MVIDDDETTLHIIESYFSARGFGVETFDDPEVALTEFSDARYDLLLLDVQMPVIDGFAVCREIRKRSEVPIIFLTAEAQEMDRVIGLELGADDYVTKPFSNRELEARIKLRLRNHQRLPDLVSDVSQGTSKLRFEGWTLDVNRHELRDSDGNLVPLTGGEYRLLDVFLNHPGRVVSRDQLMNWLKGHDAGAFDRSIDVQVGRLRKKLGDNGPQYRVIKTFRGEGYLWSATIERL